ncbi:MAG: hypothetical protein WA936_07365, partial [Erythrobacter sp.]
MTSTYPAAATPDPSSYHHPTPWDTALEPMTLPDMLERSVRRDPSAPFLHFMGRTYSYRAIFMS